MKCTICGEEIADHERTCTACGAPVAPTVEDPVTTASKEVKLLGPWGYFGLKILFSIPLVGFILLIVFSFDNKHLNRRNFARSYWCDLILSVVVTLFIVIILAATGVFQQIFDFLNYLSYLS